MVVRCPRCGLRFQREPGQWLGSWFLNICAAQVVVVALMVSGVALWYPDPPIVALAAAGAGGAVVFPVWFFPYSRTIWVAIDLAMRPLALWEDVDPRWELEADRQALIAERRAEDR